MSDLDEDFAETSEGFQSLRKDRNKLAKELDAMKAELESFKAKESRSKLEATFEAKGVPTVLADFYKEDDTSAEAVDKWIDRYKEVFHITPKADEAPPVDQATTTPPEQVAAAQRLQSLGAGSSAGGGLTLEQQIAQAADPAALTALLQAHKIKVVG